MKRLFITLCLLMCCAGCDTIGNRPPFSFQEKFEKILGLNPKDLLNNEYLVTCKTKFGGFACVGVIKGTREDIFLILQKTQDNRLQGKSYTDAEEKSILRDYLSSLYKKVGAPMPFPAFKGSVTEYSLKSDHSTLSLYSDEELTRLFVVWLGEKTD